MKTGIEALPQDTQEAIAEAEAAIPPAELDEIRERVESGVPESVAVAAPAPVVESGRMITLIVPDGAWDYPISHGERSYYPRRLQTDQRYPNASKDFGGPWVVDVPMEIYHHFMGSAGFAVYEGK